MAFVQAEQATSDADLGSIAATFDTSVTSGNLIYVALSHGGDAATWGVTDNQGNTYTQIRNTRDATNHQDITTFYAKNVTGGSVTVTGSLDPTTRTFRRISIVELSGRDTTAPLDVENGNASLTGSNATDGVVSGSITPTANGAMVVGAVMDTTGVASISAGTGFTERSDLGGLQVEDLTQATAASIQATWTFSAANGYVAHVAAFKAAGSGGTDATVSAAVGQSTASSVAPPRPRPAHPFSEINVRM